MTTQLTMGGLITETARAATQAPPRLDPDALLSTAFAVENAAKLARRELDHDTPLPDSFALSSPAALVDLHLGRLRDVLAEQWHQPVDRDTKRAQHAATLGRRLAHGAQHPALTIDYDDAATTVLANPVLLLTHATHIAARSPAGHQIGVGAALQWVTTRQLVETHARRIAGLPLTDAPGIDTAKTEACAGIADFFADTHVGIDVGPAGHLAERWLRTDMRPRGFGDAPHGQFGYQLALQAVESPKPIFPLRRLLTTAISRDDLHNPGPLLRRLSQA